MLSKQVTRYKRLPFGSIFLHRTEQDCSRKIKNKHGKLFIMLPKAFLFLQYELLPVQIIPQALLFVKLDVEVKML